MPTFGMYTFPTEYSLQPADVAQAIEERALDAFYVCEHTHIPTSKQSRYPGGEYPKEFWHCYDPIVALTVAAGVTTRIKLGTLVTLVAQRDQIIAAKQFATIDRLSNGRLILGCGAGWNRDKAIQVREKEGRR